MRYDLLYLLTAILGSPWFAYTLLRTGKWRTDWRGRFGRCAPLPRESRPTVLVHGVSVGEVSAARGLVSLLGEGTPPTRVVVSSTTNTGVARAQALFGAERPIVRFPFDLSWVVRRFLDAVRPDIVVLMELEVWPNFMAECARRGIAVVVVNGRLSASSVRGYRRVRRLVRPMFGRVAAVGAQTDEYARRFVELGVPEERVTVTDTMKWDNVAVRDSIPGAGELAAALGIDRARPLVVAGSTGPGEERLLLDSRPEGVQLLLVPRKPERFDEVARLAPGIVRRSERTRAGSASAQSDAAPEPAPHPGNDGSRDAVFLLDTMGELDEAYALADIVVIGRSFAPMGGSDPIPAVALGRPAVLGPNHQNFDHVVAALERAGAIVVSSEPMRAVAELLADPERRTRMAARGREVIREHRGASRRSAELVWRVLSDRGGA